MFIHLIIYLTNSDFLRILNDPTWSASLRGVSGSVDIIISDMISFVKGRA